MSPEELAGPISAAVAKYPAVSLALMYAVAEKETNLRNIQNLAGYPAYGPWQVVSSEKIPGRPTGDELLDDLYLSAEWAARIIDSNLKLEKGNLERAMWRYSGGSAWNSYESYKQAYWTPLQLLLAKWELKLQEGGVGRDWTQYPRPADDTGAGVHGGANAWFPLGDNDGLIPGILDEMHRCGLRWVKLLDADGSSYNACRMVLERGMMPVVRLYRERPYPGTLTDKQLAAAADLVRLGVRYFERGNEPNVDWEWQPDKWPGYDWNAWTPAIFERLAAEWLTDARKLAALGALVALDAPSPGGHYDDVLYWQNILRALKAQGGAALLRESAWLSVHNAGLNHPPDYPDDARNQQDHPGVTILGSIPGEPPSSPSNCIRKHEKVYAVARAELGFELPVLCTEGGWWAGSAHDPRYPELTYQEASKRQADTLRGMRTAPSWLLAQMPWLWFNRLGANLEQGFERDAWKRVPGFGSCPSWEPSVLPIIADLQANPCQRRQTPVMPAPTPQPTPNDPAQPVAITAEDMQRAREGLGIVPATIKAAVERGHTWLNEIYSPGDEYALALVWDGTGYRVLKLDARQWQIVGEAAL